MNVAVNVELAALMEKLRRHDLPSAAGAMLRAWCESSDTDQQNAAAFVKEMIAANCDKSKRGVLLTRPSPDDGYGLGQA
jgi:hypothetical protein